MGRSRFQAPLILGLTWASSLIVGSSAQDAHGLPNIARPEFPDKDGCITGARTTVSCPARMECFPDDNYKNGGRCDCNPLWFKIPGERGSVCLSLSWLFWPRFAHLTSIILGKLPFNDSEWDDGFSSSDCDSNFLSRFIGAAFYWAMAIMRMIHLVSVALFVCVFALSFSPSS